VIVDPGTVITWTNNSSTPQTVISGLHSDMKMEMEMEEEDEHDEENKEGEIEIGFLEVQPR
jgi:plastocyanin